MNILKYLFYSIFLFFSNSAIGQMAHIFDYEWHLDQISIGNVGYTIPESPDSNLILGGAPDFPLTVSFCSILNANVQYLFPDSAPCTLYNYSGSSISCSSEELQNFDNLYMSFWSAPNVYAITLTSENPPTLQVFNSYGNRNAHYYGSLLNANNFKSINIAVFPNPSSDVLYIKSSSQNQVYNCRFYNLLGKLCLEKLDISANQPIDITCLKNSIYILEIQNGSEKVRKKIIKL